MGLFVAFWHYAAGKRRQVVLSSSLLVMAELVRLAFPWLTAQAINSIQQPAEGHMERAGLMVVAIIAAMCVVWMFHGPGRVLERGVAMHVRRRVYDSLYAKLGRLPLVWHESHHSGETLQRITKTSSALSSFAASQFLYLQNTVRLVGPLVALYALSHVTGLLALSGYLALGVMVLLFDRVTIRLANVENEADRRHGASLVEFVGNIQSVLAMRLQQATRTLLGDRLDAVLKPLGRSIVITEFKWGAMEILSTAITWLVVIVYAIQTRDATGTLLLGNVFMVLQYASQSGGVIAALAANFAQFARYRVDYASADAIMGAPDAPAWQPGIAHDWREIRVDALAYTRMQRASGTGGSAVANAYAIDAAGLTFKRGEKIAVIGPSGSGKSTMMRVLGGLYDAEQAAFTIDGKPVSGLRSLGRTATYVPQDAEVFEGSVLDNLTFGAQRDPMHIATAVRASAFDNVMAQLPQGLQTMVVERGTNLSGGQKQRLALARGLLAASDSSLVMLDEPTSALDSNTETQVFERMREALPDATVIASVHRLSVLGHFDRVVLMQRGRIVDIGTVDELRARSDLFRQMQRGLVAVGSTSDANAAGTAAASAPAPAQAAVAAHG